VLKITKQTHSPQGYGFFVHSHIINHHSIKLTAITGHAQGKHDLTFHFPDEGKSLRPQDCLDSPGVGGNGLSALLRLADEQIDSHLIFWSFIPRIQLEGERQASKVEMEQLLCSVVNWTRTNEEEGFHKRDE